MSAFLPSGPHGAVPDRDHPTLRQRPLSPAEQRARWAVRAAQWRARELAEQAFGSVSSMGLIGIRGEGPLRGLLRLDVPFRDLAEHRDREARFLDAVGADPLLSLVPLVFTIAPDAD